MNEKEPTNIDLRFTEPNGVNEALSLILVRAAGDTGALSATVVLNGENCNATLDVTSAAGLKISDSFTGKILKVL